MRKGWGCDERRSAPAVGGNDGTDLRGAGRLVAAPGGASRRTGDFGPRPGLDLRRTVARKPGHSVGRGSARRSFYTNSVSSCVLVYMWNRLARAGRDGQCNARSPALRIVPGVLAADSPVERLEQRFGATKPAAAA